VNLTDVDLKPDVTELCGLVSSGDCSVPTSGSAQRVVHSLAYVPVTTTSTQLSYSTALTPGITTASDPLAGLSGINSFFDLK